MKVLITGSNGQLGYELRRTAAAGVAVTGLDLPELDIGDRAAVLAAAEAAAPDVIINAAAYTAVDRAESDRETAYRANASGAENMALAAAAVGARLVHVSTDFIFDGRSGSPYRPDAAPAPLGVYGASKLEGERLVRQVLGEQALLLRTSWVYSSHGGNFVKTMLRLMAERSLVRVIADQVGSPTWANGLAEAIWRGLERGVSGTHHWTDAGVASWYDFAVAIAEEGLELGLLEQPATVLPIATTDYPTPAQRPAYSVLDKSDTWAALGLTSRHWRQALRLMLAALKQSHAAPAAAG